MTDASHSLVTALRAKLARAGSKEPGEARLRSFMGQALDRGELRLPLVGSNVLRVLQLMRDEDVDLEALTTAVEHDPSLATKVVGVANSAFFRGQEAALAVRPALLRMGLAEARSIVTAVVLRSSVFSVRGEAARAEALWRHSALTGLACQALLEDHPPWGGSGFLLGLVHDVGRLVVMASAAELRDRRHVRVDDAALEAVMDAIHPELGALVAQAWGFPPVFVEAVLAHHGPEANDGPDNLLAWGIYAADTIANLHQRDWRPGSCEENDALVTQLLEPLGIDLVHCGKLLNAIEDGFAALTAHV